MKSKSALRTVRFTPEETKQVDTYLKQNPIFESFSSLARVATLSFVDQEFSLHLKPIAKHADQRPPFLWDYDLTEVQVREILSQAGLSDQKKWLIEKILSQARFDETIQYLDIEAIRKALPHLRLPPKIRERWEYALKRWSHHE